MGKHLRYTAIGDSLTEGYGVPAGCGFVDRLADLAEKAWNGSLLTDNFGKSGATAGEILEWLRQSDEWQSSVARADLVTITAGGNDLVLAAQRYYADGNTQHLVRALKDFQHRLGSLLLFIHHLQQATGKASCIRVIGLYNPLPQFTEAVFWVKRFNAQMEKLAARVKRLTGTELNMVRLHDAFSGREDELLGEDGFHPSVQGYELIAGLVHEAGYDFH